jgi:hypothetical protein
MAITEEMRTSVLELYTGYFNRAADTDGVDYWLNEMYVNNWSLDMVAQTFSQQMEYYNLYGGKSNSEIVSLVYNNVLNREADIDGAAYWEWELDNGTMSVTNLVQAVLNAANEVVAGVVVNPIDKAVLDNKTEASRYAYDNNNSKTNIDLSTITSDYNTLVSVINNIIPIDNSEYYDDFSDIYTEEVVDIVDDGSYSGLFYGDLYGDININILGDSATGDWYSPSYNEYGFIYGTVDNTTGEISLYSQDEDGLPITLNGIVSNDTISGSWEIPLYGDGGMELTVIA